MSIFSVEVKIQTNAKRKAIITEYSYPSRPTKGKKFRARESTNKINIDTIVFLDNKSSKNNIDQKIGINMIIIIL